MHRRLLPPGRQRRDRRGCLPHRHDGGQGPERTAEAFAADKYQDYLLHGLGVEMAEAPAEYRHHRIRHRRGYADEDAAWSWPGLFRQQYRRPPWGYPGLPRPRGQPEGRRAARRRAPRHRGVRGDGFQYQPEQTTSAIIRHHPSEVLRRTLRTRAQRRSRIFAFWRRTRSGR
ncbi:MAG: vitamin B12 dependent-methionine synthase activation domain-containing protein [Acidimicrobiales bacterium]